MPKKIPTIVKTEIKTNTHTKVLKAVMLIISGIFILSFAIVYRILAIN